MCVQCAAPDDGHGKSNGATAAETVCIAYVCAHTARGIREYQHTGTFRRVYAARGMLASGTIGGAAAFCAVHAVGWSAVHAEFLLGRLARWGAEPELGAVQTAVLALRQADRLQWWGPDVQRYDSEVRGAGRWSKPSMEPENVCEYVHSRTGKALFGTIAEAVGTGAIGAASQQEAILEACKACKMRGDYLSTHLYRAIARALEARIESTGLPRMGKGFETARQLLRQTEHTAVPLHDVPALNGALGLNADWGDYGYYFCSHKYEAEMPITSLANRADGPQAWIAAMTEVVVQRRR